MLLTLKNANSKRWDKKEKLTRNSAVVKEKNDTKINIFVVC